MSNTVWVKVDADEAYPIYSLFLCHEDKPCIKGAIEISKELFDEYKLVLETFNEMQDRIANLDHH